MSLGRASATVVAGSGVARPAPHAVAVRLAVPSGPAWLVADAALVRALADRVFGGAAEATTARPLLPVEQALWLAACGALLDAAGIAGEVALASPDDDAAFGWAPLRLAGAVEGALWLVARPTPATVVRVVIASCELAADDVHALRAGDVLVAEPALLVVGDGARWHVARHDGGIELGRATTAPALATDDVEVLIVDGTATVPFDAAPGTVLATADLPALELWAAGRCLATAQPWLAAGPGAVRIVGRTDEPR